MKYSLKQLLLALSVVVLLLGAALWYSPWPRFVIQGSELARKQTLQLTTTREDDDVNGLTIRVEGELDGTATLILPWDNTQLVVGPGKISQYQPHDFYHANAVVQYLPGTAKRGQIVIEYDFW